MKYLVKTRTIEIWNHWYEVEADSGDEASRLITDGEGYFGNARDYAEKFVYTDEEEVEEVEPLTGEENEVNETY